MANAALVVVFDLHKPTPVFHEQEEWNGRTRPEILDDGWKRSQTRTICGITMWRGEWTDLPGGGPSPTRNEYRSGTYLRSDHAGLIGRPCARCYPPEATA